VDNGATRAPFFAQLRWARRRELAQIAFQFGRKLHRASINE
jgi:hypothetical protein